MREIYIVGFGGFAREVYWYAKELKKDTTVVGFVDKYKFGYKDLKIYDGVPVYDEITFDYTNKNIVIGTGYPELREKIYINIVNHFDCVTFPNIISPSAHIMSKERLNLGQGIIICAGCILTCDIMLRDFVNLNLNTTVGHDTIIKEFSTTATNVSISGNAHLGKKVYLGNNSSVKEGCQICDNVVVGMGGVVVKDIIESGVYTGIPVKRRN